MLLEKYIVIRIIDAAGQAFEVKTPAASGKEVRIPFNISGSSKRDPDKAEVTIYNLPASIRAKIEKDATQIEIYAGTEPNPPRLFKGEVLDAPSPRSDDFTTWETHIMAEDTKSALRTRTYSKSYADGTSIKSIFEDLASAGGLQPDVKISGRSDYPFAVLGPVRDCIQEACERFGCRYQIIEQRLVVRTGDETVNTVDVPLISPETGLKGIPTSSLEKGKKVKVTAVSKLNAALVPGGKCVLKTNATTGGRNAKIKSGALYFIEQRNHTNPDRGGMTSTVIMRYYE